MDKTVPIGVGGGGYLDLRYFTVNLGNIIPEHLELSLYTVISPC